MSANRVSTCKHCGAWEEFGVNYRGQLYIERVRRCVCLQPVEGAHLESQLDVGSPRQEQAKANGKLGGKKRMGADPGMRLARQAKKLARDMAIIEALAGGARAVDVARRFHVTPSLVSQIKSGKAA